MNTGHQTRRGDPLLLLGLLLIGWVGMRAALWLSPFETDPSRRAPAGPSLRDGAQVMARGTGSAQSPSGSGPQQRADADLNHAAPEPSPLSDYWHKLDRPLPSLASMAVRGSSPHAAVRAGRVSSGSGVGRASLTTPRPAQAALPPSRAGGVDLAQGNGRPAAPAQDAQVSAAAPDAPVLVRNESIGQRMRRWTADAWLLLREDSAAPLLAGQPSYGRSQAGAVLRYWLAPSSAHRPQAYVRASGALEKPRDVEVAGGVSARPIAGVPMRVAAELRVADTQAGTDLRPAAYAVSEFPPLALPLGARGEAYVQGGYVGGEFATPFIDGQARIVRDVAELGAVRVAAGAGAWGGAQQDASRLDVGPSALLSFRLGEVNARVAVDYRFRVAGDAQPASGPALTLATGF